MQTPNPHRWRALAVLAIAQFMVILDVTVMNVALPTIGGELELGEDGLPWLVAAYTLPYAALLLLGGRLADALGRRPVLLAGLAVFSLGSLASGLAQSEDALIAARVVQGLGGALLSPAALSIVAVLFADPGERRRALTMWGGIGAAGGAAGLVLGGVLTETLGWRSVFLVNVPVGVVAGVLMLRWLAPMRHAGARVRDLDLAGALLAVVAFGGLVLAANRAAAEGFTSAPTVAAFAAGVAGLVAFAAAESRAASPLLPVHALRNGPLMAGTALMFVGAGTLVAAIYVGSLHLQRGLGFDALETGLAFLPVALLVGIGAHVGGHAAERVGVRAVAAGGLAVATAGAVLLATLVAGNGYAVGVLPGLVVLGLGLGATFVAATTTAMTSVGDDVAGLASGLSSTAHELGASFGVAVLGAIAGGAAVAGDVETAYTVSGAVLGAGALAAALRFPRVSLGDRPAFAHH